MAFFCDFFYPALDIKTPIGVHGDAIVDFDHTVLSLD
jgi:hypothetical protein